MVDFPSKRLTRTQMAGFKSTVRGLKHRHFVLSQFEMLWIKFG